MGNFKPTIYNIGYNDVSNGRNHYLYRRWVDIIYRCYKPTDASYHKYGAKGITVSDRWHYFSNFIKDCESLDGFDKERIIEGELALDKDKLQQGVDYGDMSYSSENCCWVTIRENNQIMYKKKVSRQEYFKASKESFTFYHYNQREFSRIFGLSDKNISQCLCLDKKSHKGFTFEKILDLPDGWDDENCTKKCIELKKQYEKDSNKINTNHNFFKIYNKDVAIYHYSKSVVAKILTGKKSNNPSICNIVNHKNQYKGFRGCNISKLPEGWTIKNCTSKCEGIIKKYKGDE